MGVPSEHVNLCTATRSSNTSYPRKNKTRGPPTSARKAYANPPKNNDARPTRLANKQFIIPTFLFGVQKGRCMIDTRASVSFCSQKVLGTLRSHPHLKHQGIKTYARKLVVALGEGSTANAEEGVSINLQFATDDLQAQCAVLARWVHRGPAQRSRDDSGKQGQRRLGAARK